MPGSGYPTSVAEWRRSLTAADRRTVAPTAAPFCPSLQRLYLAAACSEVVQLLRSCGVDVPAAGEGGATGAGGGGAYHIFLVALRGPTAAGLTIVG